MRKALLLALLALTAPASAQGLAAYADALPSLLAAPRSIDPLPRADAPFWRDSIPLSMRQSYIAEGEHYLGQPWPALPLTVFTEYRENGNRTRYEALNFEERRHLAVLVMAEIVEGEGRFLPDIINGLGHLCEQTWWGLPAHYRQKTPLPEEQTVALFSAETAALVAWATYMLRPQLEAFSPLLPQRLDRELERRMLVPALEGTYWWKTAGMNWNPWICSNWLYCVLLSEHDRERQLKAIAQILQCTDTFIAAYPDDGGCDEGPGYWERAAASMHEVLATLRLMTDGAIDLSHDPKVQAMGAYVYKTYIQDGYCTTFADIHSSHAITEPNILFPFGQYLGDATLTAYAAWAFRQYDYLHRCGTLFRHEHNFPSLAHELQLLRQLPALQAVEPREPLLSDVWLESLQLLATRRGPLYLAMKGGHNDENHNHNDVGSFILYANARPLLIDPAVGSYTAQSFSKDRYQIWSTQSQYHNLPQPNGFDQQAGRAYHARLIAHRPGQMALDLAEAYPKEAGVKSWLRTVRLTKKALEVTEDYELTAFKDSTHLLFVTPIKPDLSVAGRVGLGDHALTYSTTQLAATAEDISPLMDDLLRGIWGQHLYRVVITTRSAALKQRISYKIY